MEGSDVHMLTWEEAKTRDKMISEVSYSLRVTLTKQDLFTGELTVAFTSASAGSTWLEFKGRQVDSLSLNGAPAPVDWRQWKLWLPSVRAGANSAHIAFTNAYVNDGLGLHKATDPEDGEVYLYTQFEPFAANKMFPCFDQPDIKAPLTLQVAAPADWRVIANERASSVEPLGDSLVHTFPPTPSISTYLYALCAGPYAEFRLDGQEVPLGLYCRKALAPYLNTERYFHWTVEGLKFYRGFFGRGYPFSKYDQVFVPEFNMGAMENVGCVTYRDQYIFKEGASYVQLIRVCNTFLHEMAHMWFGNLVTMKWWNDLWLNESFATFMSHLCVSLQLPGLFPDVWDEFLARKGWGYATDQLPTTHPISTPVRDTDETESNFDGISYSKGAAVLKQLYFLLGHEAFAGALQRYMVDFAYKNAEFDHLIGYLAAQAPDFDLQGWAQSWVLTAGLNELEPLLEFRDGELTKFRVRQTPALPAHPTLRSHRIKVEAFAADGSQIRKETVDILPQEFTELGSFVGIRPACVLLNVEDWGYCKIRIDEASLEFLKGNLGRLSDTLSKLLVWRALYDMVRDLRLSGAEFTEFAIQQLPLEADSSIANYALEILQPSLFNYVSVGPARDAYASHIFAIILHKIRDAPSTQDSVIFQKRLFFYLSHPADVETSVGWIRASSTGIAQFALSTQDKWSIIKKYASISTEARALVEELDDRSDVGHLAKLHCEAAYPTAEAKQAAWHRYMTDLEGMSRYERESSMSGFNRPRQGELLSAYFDTYFEKAVEFLRSKDKEVGKDFCDHLLPNYAEDSLVAERIDRMIEQVPSERFEVIRSLREKKDMRTKFARGKALSDLYISNK